MPANLMGGDGLRIVAGDVLALRATGLAAAETWALLCQAAQALQDLFLSNGGVVDGSRAGPVVTPHTLELTHRGRVLLQPASTETARAYLPPEYRPGRVYSDTESEKMWMYSLGRALLDTTPRAAALTGTVSVSPSSALQSVLAAMTEPDPRRRASLMNLLNVISEYCRTRLQTKPFTHIVMDMYREVARSPQYTARKRAVYHRFNSLPFISRNPVEQHYQVPMEPQHRFQDQNHHQRRPRQNPERRAIIMNLSDQLNVDREHHHRLPPHQRGILFKMQSRNSRSHPNLSSLFDHKKQQNQQQEQDRLPINNLRPQFQSQIDMQATQLRLGLPNYFTSNEYQHSRTNSQPIYTQPQKVKSSGNLHSVIACKNGFDTDGELYGDPLYSPTLKPFLSSQDVRVNGLSARARTNGHRNDDIYPSIPTIGYQTTGQIPVNGRAKDDIYAKPKTRVSKSCLQRQYSNPQLPIRQEKAILQYSESLAMTDNQQNQTEQQKRGVQGPPKPPRIITTLKKSTSASDVESNQSKPPTKPPRNLARNGPRARRGKAVQRAPSRLYRAIGGPTRSFNRAQCVGPEFVVRANQPAKTLNVGSIKLGNTNRLVVIMLTGQRLEVTCDPLKITAGDLFEAIVQSERLDENFTLGLAVLLAGDFAILPPETKLNKVAPLGWSNNGKNKGLFGLPTNFMLYLRLRFFLPSLRGIRNWISKHLLYLQIRRCILEQQLVCPLAELINLTGLALQAEFGNYNVNEHGCGDYFLLEHYVPEFFILNFDGSEEQTGYNDFNRGTLRSRLHQAHRERRGLDSEKAEEMFISHAQSLPDYGAHYYIATVDMKVLEKMVMSQQSKSTKPPTEPTGNTETNGNSNDNNVYKVDKSSDPNTIYGQIELSRVPSFNGKHSEELDENNYEMNKSNNSDSPKSVKNNKGNKMSKKIESNVWLAIHSLGLKLLHRGGEPRERTVLIYFQWRDIQTLSYSKNCLVVHTKMNGKRCKFKLKMDHKKSFFAFKLTSLHHQFFLRIRSELIPLQGLAKEFGVPATADQKASPSKKNDGKTKITIANALKASEKSISSTRLEEYQNKENENPQKESHAILNTLNMKNSSSEPNFYTNDGDGLYAQVNIRLEPEGESHDGDESDRLANTKEKLPIDRTQFRNYSRIQGEDVNMECLYSLPVLSSCNDVDRIKENYEKPEQLYAAINKVGLPKRKYPLPDPDEVWNIGEIEKTTHQIKTSSLPNYGTSKQSNDPRTPNLPRRLGVKMGTRAIYSGLVHKEASLTDDLESLSLKSDTVSSIPSISVRSTESPLPEAYVLNADIRTNDETYCVPQDESISDSLMERLDEFSFEEERILRTIKLERGHGGSIGLQVTEGNDGGVYVQAVSVGGSADMTGNVNKGDKIVAINGQNLLNLRYKDALEMLQSPSETIELVLSQITQHKNINSLQQKNNYFNDIREVCLEVETSSLTNKWLGTTKTTDVASVQNTSSAYSSAASSAMGNHNANGQYLNDIVNNETLKSASMLLSIEDFDVSRTSSRQVFI